MGRDDVKLLGTMDLRILDLDNPRYRDGPGAPGGER